MARPSVWVDRHAAVDGDGSRAAPLKRLPEAIAPGSDLHLMTGLYEGPVILPPGAALHGHGQVVVVAPAEGVAVEARDASLTDLSVQGGEVGLRTVGSVRASGVHFSGHRRAGAEATAGTSLALAHCTFEAPVAGSVGVLVDGARAQLLDVRFISSFARAIDATGSALVLRRVTASGTGGLLRLRSGSVDGAELSAISGQGPALFISGARATLEGITVQGHEYGLQLGHGAQVTLARFSSRNAQLAAITAVEASLSATDVRVEASGPHGAVHMLGGTLTLDGFTAVNVHSLGLFLRQTTAHLKRVRVAGVAAERTGSETSLGDALHLRGGVVTGDSVISEGAQGSALFASMHADVRLVSLTALRSGAGAVFVERDARVTLGTLTARGAGPALVVPERAVAEVAQLLTDGPEVPVWAECSAGAEVRLGALVSPVAQPPAPCIGALTPDAGR